MLDFKLLIWPIIWSRKITSPLVIYHTISISQWIRQVIFSDALSEQYRNLFVGLKVSYSRSVYSL